MAEKSVIIIGAGLSGLATGIYAQMNGYRTRIFEHHSQPGGVASHWKRKGYLIDGGIHFVMGYKPGTALYETYRELGVVPSTRFVEMNTWGRYVNEASGKGITITRDLDRFAADLRALSPKDAAAVDDLLSGIRAFQGIGMSDVGLSKPPELTKPWDQVKMMWQMRRVLKYFGGKYNRPMAEYSQSVNDPWLHECIENLFLPEVPVWFVFMTLALFADGQLGLLEGGCQDFVGVLEKRYLDLGGQVTYKATVDKILTENNCAIGIRLRDGGEHRADAVISAADGHSTIFDMLEGRYISKEIRERYDTWKLFRPLMMISYGVAAEYPDEPSLVSYKLAEPIRVGSQKTAFFFVRLFNYSPCFAPNGKTVVQVGFDADWDYWNALQKCDRSQYDAEKDEWASRVLERLESHFPGIAGKVKVTDVATPYTMWRYTLNHRGAWEGWMMTPESIRSQFPRMLPGLANFYMAGQWVMPGGGVVPCLYSGKHAVQLMCHKEKKSFRSAAI